MIIDSYCWASRLLLSIRGRVRSERGASLVEYALLVALIAMVCLVAVVFFGNSVSNSFSRTGSAVGVAGN